MTTVAIGPSTSTRQCRYDDGSTSKLTVICAPYGECQACPTCGSGGLPLQMPRWDRAARRSGRDVGPGGRPGPDSGRPDAVRVVRRAGVAPVETVQIDGCDVSLRAV